MELWHFYLAGLVALFILSGLAAFGIHKAMKKFNRSNSLDLKYRCTLCNRYYNNINEHLIYHGNNS